MRDFRIYKSVVGKPRKDGSCVVSSFGCDGKNHVVTYDAIWFDIFGKPSNGMSGIRPTKELGSCDHGRTCKNLGFFRLFN